MKNKENKKKTNSLLKSLLTLLVNKLEFSRHIFNNKLHFWAKFQLSSSSCLLAKIDKTNLAKSVSSPKKCSYFSPILSMGLQSMRVLLEN